MAAKEIQKVIENYTAYDGYDQHDDYFRNWIGYTNAIVIPTEKITEVEVHLEFVPYDRSSACLSSDYGLLNTDKVMFVCPTTSVGAGNKLSDFTLLTLSPHSGWPIVSPDSLSYFNNNKGKAFHIAFETGPISDHFSKIGPDFDYFMTSGWITFTCDNEKIKYPVTENLSHVIAIGNPSTIEKGAIQFFDYDTEPGYQLPANITVTGATIEDWDPDYHSLSIKNPTGPVTITIIGDPISYNIINNLTNITSSTSNRTTIKTNENVKLKYLASSGYTLPEVVNQSNIDGATFVSWNKNKGELVIKNPEKDVTITLSSSRSEVTIREILTNITADPENPKTAIPGEEPCFTYYIENGFVPPEKSEIKVTGATIKIWDSPIENTYELYLTNITSDITITINAKLQNFAITNTLSNVTANSSNINNIDYNGTRVLTFTANTGYELPPAVSVSGAIVVSWDKSTGKLTIKNPTKPVTVNITAVKKSYSITNILTNITANSGNPTSIEHLGTKVLTYTANIGYNLPSIVNQSNITGATFVSWDKSTGRLEIKNPIAAVKITMTGSIKRYVIKYSLSNVTANPSNPIAISHKGSATLKFSPSPGYLLPEDITITGATRQSWNSSLGILVIKNPTDNVNITVNGKIINYEIIYDLSNIISNVENPSSINYGETKTLNFTPKTGYTINSEAEITGATVSSWNSDSGILVIKNPVSFVKIKLTASIKSYSISSLLSNMTSSSGNRTTINYGETITLQYSPNTGYNLPSTVNQSNVNGATFVSWSISGNTGLLTIKNPTKSVSINLSSIIKSYSITNSLTNTHANENNATKLEYGKSVTLIYSANSGFNLPDSVTQSNITGATFVSWDKSTGKLTIKNPTGNITIKIASTAKVYTITKTLSNITGDNSNNYTITHGKSRSLIFTANIGYTLPSTVNQSNVTGATFVSWDKSTGRLEIKNPTSNVTIKLSATINSYSIVNKLDCILADRNNPTSITHNSQVSLAYSAPSGYKLPATVYQANISNATLVGWSITNGIGTLIIKNPTGPVTITLSANSQAYAITINSNHITQDSNNPSFIHFNSTATLNFSPTAGYHFPSDVTVEGATKQSWNDASGTLIIKNPTGPVTITIIGDPIPYNIIAFLTNLTEDANNVGLIKTGQTVTLVYNAVTGYTLPEVVNQSNITGAIFVSWNKDNGKLTIKDPTDIVKITMSGVRRQYNISTSLANTSANLGNVNTILYGLNATLKFTANIGYLLPDSVTVSGVNSYTWNKDLGELKLVGATGNVSIVIKSIPKTYSIANSLSHTKPVTANPTSIKTAETKTLNYTADIGYYLPGNILVNNATLSSWNKSTGEVIIKNPTGNVTISIQSLPKSYTISNKLSKLYENTDNVKTINRDSTAILAYHAAEGYNLPSTVNQSNVTGATFVGWDKSVGQLEIKNPTENVNIKLSAIPKLYAVSSTLVHTLASTDNASSIARDSSLELVYSAENGYLLPDEIDVNGASLVSWDSSTGLAVIKNPTGPVSIKITSIPKTYSITNTLTYSIAGDNPISIKTGETKVLTYTAKEGYNLPSSVTVSGATKQNWEIKNSVGSLTIKNPTGNVSITVASTPKVFQITESLTKTTSSGNPSTINFNGSATLHFKAVTGYSLPGSVRVSGAKLESWNPSSGILVIKVTEIPSTNIKITVVSTPNAYNITNNLLYCHEEPTNPTIIHRDEEISLFYVQNTGYVFTELTQSNITGATFVSWDKYELIIKNPIGNVTINITAIPREYEIKTVLTNITADSSNVTKIKYNGTANLLYSANTGYLLPTYVTVENVESHTWNQATGALSLVHPSVKTINDKIKVIISAEPKKFSISYDIENVKISQDNKTSISYNSTLSLKFIERNGYSLPTLTQANVTGAIFVSWSASNSEGILTIKNPTENVKIVNVKGIAKSYNVTSDLQNVTIKGPTTILTDSSITLTLRSQGNYDLPLTVKVINATIANWTRTSDKNAILNIKNPTGNVIITTEEASGFRSIFISNSQVSSIYIGSEAIKFIYVGTELIWKTGKLKQSGMKSITTSFSKLLNSYTFTGIPLSAFNFSATITNVGSSSISIDKSKLSEGKVTVSSGTLYTKPTEVTIRLYYNYY